VHTLSPDDDAKLREIADAVTDLRETCDLGAEKLVDAHRDRIVRVAETKRERRYLHGDPACPVVPGSGDPGATPLDEIVDLPLVLDDLLADRHQL
jgi:hypothetical protein